MHRRNIMNQMIRLSAAGQVQDDRQRDMSGDISPAIANVRAVA
jgi:hypothetical protein